MALRRKRSISVPPDLDAQILTEAARDGMTYSAWVTATARKELLIRAGLSAVAEVERELGRFTDEELADAEKWARETIERSRRTATREQRAA
jgi:hypothetical protein